MRVAQKGALRTMDGVAEAVVAEAEEELGAIPREEVEAAEMGVSTQRLG